MWLPLAIYLFLNIKHVSLFESSLIEVTEEQNEPAELTELFIENLKVDPLLLDNGISENTKVFINNKIERFINLVSHSQNADFSRGKRSLKEQDKSYIRKNSIGIFPENIIPAEYSEDIRLFRNENDWFAVSLEDKNGLAIYQNGNGSFQKLLDNNIHYNTNVAAITIGNLSLICVGENKGIKVFQFHFKEKKIEAIQTIKVENPKHVVMWEQDHVAYLAITDEYPADLNRQKSNIKVYQWLGKHFDHVQDIQLFNIKKTVPFGIHGSYFIAALNNKQAEDEVKTYSEIWKFDMHSMKYESFQRLLTNGCIDIKYFVAELHGEDYHFLVVVHSVSNDLSLEDDSKSVIYRYDDQYFIPFQSIMANAIKWQPIQDLKGNAALISISADGLKGFQYDGWHFYESAIVFNNEHTTLRFEDVTALHTYDFDGKQILVIACNHCKNNTNMYSVNFTNVNKIKEQHSQLLNWCTESLNALETSDQPELVAESLRGDLHEQISLEEDQEHQYSAALIESSDTLLKIEDIFKHSFLPDSNHVFENNIEAEMIIFNNDAAINSVHSPNINDITMDSLLENILDIEEGFQLDNTIDFNLVVSEKPLNPKKINNVPLEEYVTINQDKQLEKFSVHGSVTLKNGLNVKESINNVSITEKTLLLKEGDQTFATNFSINELGVENLTTSSLNGVNLDYLPTNTSQEVSHIKHLKVKDLEIGGVMNRVSIPVLARRALKKVGDQVLVEPIISETLIVESINVKGNISGKQVPSDFVLINSGEFTVNQDVEFLKGLKINKLEVLHSLNNISVTDNGDLDILLMDALHLQEIPSKKTFENLKIINPIKLRNKIINAQMQRLNPILIDTKTYQLDDVTINGHIDVTRWLKVTNLKPENGNITLGDVLDKGLKLTNTEIPMHLNFTQPLDLEDIIADRVNTHDPHDWMLETSNSSQIITGEKIFSGDIHLKGHVNAFKMNDVDVHALERDALRTEGDQTIEGVWKVNKVVSKASIISNMTILKNSHQNDGIMIVNKDLKVTNLNTTNLVVKGLINTLNTSQIVKNVVIKDAKYQVMGEKYLNNLHVENLVIQDGDSELLQLLHDVFTNQITLNKSVDLFNEIHVNNLKFGQNINNISKENFDDLMNFTSDANDITNISTDMEYDEIVVLGDVFITDNSINGKNLTAIEVDTVKVDEDFEFNDVKFGEAVFVRKTLHLDGNIENLDIDNIVEQSSNETMNIQDKIFMESVLINGTLFINNTVNGVDLNKFCTFSQPSEKLKTLKIQGDVMFVKGPKVLNINNMSVKYLKETLWFSDKSANISGDIRLGNTSFNNSVEVLRFVDATNLSLLAKNYLSKSKNQVISANIAFDQVTFSNISTPALTTKGPINGISTDHILKTMLLQGVPQMFENPAYFEEVKVEDLDEDTDYTVNGLNLRTDVMRYDKHNIVTGQKIFNNLNVDILNLTHHVKIQTVDVLDWLANAILVNGTFGIKGKKILESSTFKQGLSLRGKVNGQDFNKDTVMLANTIQNITGKKSFITNDSNPTKFKTLRIKGLANGVNIEKLVKNQTNRHQNTTLHSKIIFDNNVEVKNINVDILYDNINVSELISNVSKLRNLGSFEGKFKELLDMGIEVEQSIKGQASLFKYYKEIMQLENVYDLFGIKCKDDVFRLVAFHLENDTNVFRTFEWNPEARTFIISGQNIESNSKPNYMKQISLGDKDYLYIEHLIDYEAQSYKPIFSGRLLQLINPTTFELVVEFHRNATVSLFSFVNPALNKPCLGFIGNTLSGVDVYCDETDPFTFYWTQRIRMEGVYKASTLQTQDSVYLFLARRGLPFKEPSIVVFRSSVESTDFVRVQTIFEGADLNGLVAASIGGVPYLIISFGSQEATVESGWISVRRLDPSTEQFLQWQHLPITAPLDVHLVTQTSFEPLLLIPTADASAPLQIFRYDGIAGFRRILKGSSLPISSKIRIIGDGHFLVTLQEQRYIGTVLGAVVKGSVRN